VPGRYIPGRKGKIMKIRDIINNHQYVCWEGSMAINTIDITRNDENYTNIEYIKTVKYKDFKDEYPEAYEYIKANGAEDADDDNIDIYVIDGDNLYVCEFWQ